MVRILFDTHADAVVRWRCVGSCGSAHSKLAVLVVGAVATDAYIQTLGAIIVVNVALLTHVKFMPCRDTPLLLDWHAPDTSVHAPLR